MKPGKKIGAKRVRLSDGREYNAELRYSQETKLFYGYWKDEGVSAETENELYPLLKALVEKHELLRFEYYISVEVSAMVDDSRGLQHHSGHGVGMETLEEDAPLYELSLVFRVFAVAENELAEGRPRIHYRDIRERDGKLEMRNDIREIEREDMNTWVKYTPERLETLKQVRRGMVKLHNALVGLFADGGSAAKFLDAPHGFLLLPGKGAKERS